MRDKLTKPSRPMVETMERAPDFDNPDDRAFQTSSVAKFRLVWEKRKFVLRCLVYGAAASLLIAFLIPKRYESVARLMPPDQSNSGLAMLAAQAGGRSGAAGGAGTLGSGLGAGLGSIAGDLLGMKSSGQLFVAILRSQTVEDDLIGKFNLRKVYWDRYVEDARSDLEEKTDAAEDRKSGIVTIRVMDRDPKRAVALAQEYISELNRVVTSLNTSAARREREFLEGRLTQVKQDLETAENGFSDFASKNTALDIPAQGKAMIEASAALEGQLIGAQTELESLRQIYADGNVRVRATQARVNELRHQLDQIGGKFDSTSQSGGAANTSMYPSIRKLPILGVRYADLYRNTKVEEATFETLTAEYELAKVQEVKETPSVKVLDPPSSPEKKSYPPRMLIVFLGSIAAMALGVFWILGTASWTDIDAGDPRKALILEISQTTRAHLPWGASNGTGSTQSEQEQQEFRHGERGRSEKREP